MGSSVNVGQGYEHKRFKPPSLANMYATVNYVEEVDTPESKAFVKKWKAKFPNEPYINQEAENSYHAVYLYKQMVERACCSTSPADLASLIAIGEVSVDCPETNGRTDPK